MNQGHLRERDEKLCRNLGAQNTRKAGAHGQVVVAGGARWEEQRQHFNIDEYKFVLNFHKRSFRYYFRIKILSESSKYIPIKINKVQYFNAQYCKFLALNQSLKHVEALPPG